jgi:hypothetical protein
MQSKKYSSYAQIDRELEILKIEKEINYQKIVFNIQKTKESFSFPNITKSVLGSVKTSFMGSYGSILRFAIPIIIKWLKNKKRGN